MLAGLRVHSILMVLGGCARTGWRNCVQRLVRVKCADLFGANPGPGALDTSVRTPSGGLSSIRASGRRTVEVYRSLLRRHLTSKSGRAPLRRADTLMRHVFTNLICPQLCSVQNRVDQPRLGPVLSELFDSPSPITPGGRTGRWWTRRAVGRVAVRRCVPACWYSGASRTPPSEALAHDGTCRLTRREAIWAGRG